MNEPECPFCGMPHLHRCPTYQQEEEEERHELFKRISERGLPKPPDPRNSEDWI